MDYRQEKMKEYIIEKGKHKANGLNIGITLSRKIKFKAKFDKSCIYKIDGIDAYDVNKLYGFSTTWFHHRQSARVGWRCLDGENIQIVTYSYNHGNRVIGEIDVLGVVKPDEEFICTIQDKEREYFYTFEKDGEITTASDQKKPDWFFFHHKLYPYFGGNNPAPHRMKIFLEIL